MTIDREGWGRIALGVGVLDRIGYPGVEVLRFMVYL